MGNYQSIQKANFEDIQYILQKNKGTILLNTLHVNNQSCLIPNTLPLHSEESVINEMLNTNKNGHIVIYGKNSNDESIFKKSEQLTKLGFSNVYVYIGGMFEWLCLQDIYGDELFPTTKKELDILKYKPTNVMNKYYLTN
tara:strand:- start:835 stop:1254 length:420 start_codon:yes stop_codon:yes gene_type:complete